MCPWYPCRASSVQISPLWPPLWRPPGPNASGSSRGQPRGWLTSPTWPIRSQRRLALGPKAARSQKAWDRIEETPRRRSARPLQRGPSYHHEWDRLAVRLHQDQQRSNPSRASCSRSCVRDGCGPRGWCATFAGNSLMRIGNYESVVHASNCEL